MRIVMPAFAVRSVRIPAGPGDGVAATKQETVAGMCAVEGSLVSSFGVVRFSLLVMTLLPRLKDVEQQLVVALGGIDRTQDEQVGFVFDHARGVARRTIDTDDHLVAWIGWIELAASDADDPLIGAGVAECGARGERFHAIDPHCRHVCRCRPARTVHAKSRRLADGRHDPHCTTRLTEQQRGLKMSVLTHLGNLAIPVIARSEATQGSSPWACAAISIAVHNGMGIASLRSQ